MHPENTADPPPNSANAWGFSLLLLILFAVYGVVVYRAKSVEIRGMQHLGVGNSLADFELVPLLNTTTAVSRADVNGQVVLLNYWGPWCGPCLAEFPELVALEKKFHANKQVRFLLVASDNGVERQSREELAEDTQAVLNRERANLPIYCDPKRSTMSAIVTSARLTEFGFPTTILVDAQGVIQGVWQGYEPASVEEMRILLERLTSQ